MSNTGKAEQSQSPAYFELDGRYYRRWDNSNSLFGVDDVLRGLEWRPYQGDRIRPVFFGSRVPEEEVLSILQIRIERGVY